MPKVRVLILGDDDFWVDRWAQRRNLEGDVDATVLDSAEVYDARGYKISPRGVRLATEATPNVYDIVVIGNNRGTGMEYAAVLPIEMLARTVVIWNRYRPGDERCYDGLGIKRFCSREELPVVMNELYDEFVAQTA